MNIADQPPSKAYINEKYPYLYDDLVKNLRAKKAEIEEYIKAASEDPTLQTSDTKVKEYNVDQEIGKLRKFIDSGWMTNAHRPKPPAPEEAPELPAPEQPN